MSNSEQAANQALERHRAGDFQQAERLYREVLQTEPRHGDANHNLGVLLIHARQAEAALPYLKAAVEINPSKGRYWLSYIEGLLASGNSQDAFIIVDEGRRRGLEGPEVEALRERIAASLKPGPSQRAVDALMPLFAGHRYAEVESAARKMVETWPNHGTGWKALGAALAAEQRPAEALPVLQKAAELFPSDAEAHNNLGLALKDLGRLAQAQASYGRAIELRPDYSEAHNNLGSVLRALGQLDAAVRCHRRALELKPDFPLGQNNLGSVLQGLGQLQAAARCYRRAVELKPDYHVAYNNLGNALHQLGGLEEAVRCYSRALELKPDFHQAHNNLAIALTDLGRLPEAEASCRRALELRPELSEAHNNLAIALQKLGRLDEAVRSYRRALELKPENPEVLNGLGSALQELGLPEEAARCHRRALELKPDYHPAHNNLGNALQRLGRLGEAVACYRRALELKPDFHEAHGNLGIALKDLGRLSEAEASCRRALDLRPDFPEGHVNLGNALIDLGRLFEAEASFRRALELKADFAMASQSLATIRGYLSDYSEVKALSDAALKMPLPGVNDRSSLWTMRLYILSYHPDLSAEEIFSEFVRWGDRQDCSRAPASHRNERSAGRRLRVGFVSPDFRRHTSRFYFEPLFEHHDRKSLELFAYSNVKIADDYTARFKKLFDHWRDIAPMSDDAAAEQVRRDGIDILVDGCNHMRDERLGLFARKPAPVQVTWLGSAWTSGLPTMDYVLFDPYLAPAGTLARESIVRLPSTFFMYRPPAEAEAVGEAPCIRNGHVSFGYFGRTERLNHRTFRLWGRILAALPEVRLILDFRAFGDPRTREYYTEFLARHGIDVARVTMRYSKNVWQALNEIDIMLDSFPHSGGTMVFDSIWMGVPLLTLAARPTLGRIGTSIMTNLDLGEWVAADEQAYLEKAVRFAGDRERLSELRRGMRDRVAASPLRDEAGFARAVEGAYREMWRRWCAGERAEAFSISPDFGVRPDGLPGAR